MNKFTILLSLNLLISVSCYTQTSVWKVTGNGSTLYLGGTVHVLRETDFPLPAQFDSAYKMSEVIILETDIEAMEKPEVAQKMMAKVMYTDEKTLKSVLSDSAYKSLEKVCSEANIPIANLAKFKPAMVVLIATIVKMQHLGFSSSGVDKTYFSLAKKDGKKLSFLETIDEQIDFISVMGSGNESDFVLYSIEDLKTLEKDFPDLLTAWRTGSDKLFSEQSEKMKKNYPALSKSLVVDRNNNWMPEIESMLKTPETEFVLVGSLHLYTNEGIVKLLRDKGYKVEQL